MKIPFYALESRTIGRIQTLLSNQKPTLSSHPIPGKIGGGRSLFKDEANRRNNPRNSEGRVLFAINLRIARSAQTKAKAVALNLTEQEDDERLTVVVVSEVSNNTD